MPSGRQLSRIEQEIQSEREAEFKRRQEDLELLSTRRPTAVDELRNEIPTPTNTLPGNCLPDWCDLRLDQTFPNVPAPCGTFLTSIGHIGERIHPYNFCEFDLSDPLMNHTPISYNPLHDPHLKSFYQENPQVTKQLVKLGLVCCDGRVVSKLSDFNKYRKYLGRLHNLQVRKAKEQQDRWEQQACETTRLARLSAETEDRLELQNRRKLKQLTNELCDEEERRQQYLARNRPQNARMVKTRMQHDNRIKQARRETLRRETLDRARLRKQGHGDHCQQNVMEWVCKSEHYDNLRKIGRIEKQLNRQEDLCQFIQCKRAYQQSKRMQRHALLSRNKMEQECRATRRQRKYGNAPENIKRRQEERQKREQARIVREKYLIEKYGRIWLEFKRRSSPSPYLNSTWNINNVLQGVVNHVKEEAGCQNFADFMSAVLKDKRGGKVDPETKQSVQYILDCIMNATMKKYNQRHNSCEVKLEQLQRAYQDCFQGMPSPKDFESPSVPRRSRQNQIELPRPSYSAGRRSKSAKPFYDPYWSKDCSSTLEHFKGMACSQLVSQVCQQMQSSCLAQSCCNRNNCGPPCCICFPKTKKLNWCDPVVPVSSRRSRSLSTNRGSSKQTRKISKTPKTPTASPRRHTKENKKSPARSVAPSRKSRGTRGPLTAEKKSGNARPFASEDRETGTYATADRQIQSSKQQIPNTAQQQQTIDDVQNAGTQQMQPKGQNAGTAPMDNHEIKQVEVKPELGDGSTDTVDVPGPTSGTSQTQSDRDPEAETSTENPETLSGSTSAETPELAENGTEAEQRPSSATQKSEETVDKKEADTEMAETPEKGNQVEAIPQSAAEVETDKKYTSARGSQPDGLSTDKAIDADKPDSRPGTAQSDGLPETGTVTDAQSRRNMGLQPDSGKEAGTESEKADRRDAGDDPIPASRFDQSTEPQTKEDKGQDAEHAAVQHIETGPRELVDGGQNPDTISERSQGSDPPTTPVKEGETSPDPKTSQGTEATPSVENQETSPERGQDQSVESDKMHTKDKDIGQDPKKDAGQSSQPISVRDGAVGPEPGVNEGQETDKLSAQDAGTTADLIGKDQSEGSERPKSREGGQNTEKTDTIDESASVGPVSLSEQAQTTDPASSDHQATSTEKLPHVSSSAGTDSKSGQAQTTDPVSSDNRATSAEKLPHASSSTGTDSKSGQAKSTDPESSDAGGTSADKLLHATPSSETESHSGQAKSTDPASSNNWATAAEKLPPVSSSTGTESQSGPARSTDPASSDNQATTSDKLPRVSSSAGAESPHGQAQITDPASSGGHATSAETLPQASSKTGSESQTGHAQTAGPTSSDNRSTSADKLPNITSSTGTTSQSGQARSADPESSDTRGTSADKLLHATPSSGTESQSGQAKSTDPASSNNWATAADKLPQYSSRTGAESQSGHGQTSDPASSDNQATSAEKQPAVSSDAGTGYPSNQAQAASSSQEVSRQKQPTTYKICDPDRVCSQNEWDAMKIPSGEVTAAVSQKINSILGDMRDCLQQDCLQGKYDPSRRPSVPMTHGKPCGNDWMNSACASGNRRCSEMNMLGMDCFGVDLKLEEIRNKFLDTPTGASASTQQRTNSQQLQGSQGTSRPSASMTSSAAHGRSANLTTNQSQPQTITSADCSQVRCASFPNPGCLSDRDISRAASTFVSNAIQQEHRRLHDQCLSGSGDESRTGTSGIGKSTQEVLSQDRFGVSTALDTDGGNPHSSGSQSETTNSTDTEFNKGSQAAGAAAPCACIKDTVMKHLEQIRHMLAEVSSELETIGVRGCEDRTAHS